MSINIRVGFGYDVHAFAEGRELWLGGIQIEHNVGLLGHSDADVLIHAICDALLGAACMRDIGYHFPDTAGEYKNIDSKILLKETIRLIRDKGYEFGNADCTVCAEAPKLNPHVPAMALYFPASSYILSSGATLPSIENTPSVTISRKRCAWAFINCCSRSIISALA